ncbi:MAG: hypothetical protein J6113_00595, partial [Lachnospiraceae bacterium]|nr:hypothetical protein [Lachnospiraceae bacterium]
MAKKVEKLNRRRFGIDIGVIIFLFLLIAVVAGLINRLSKSQLKIYEVTTTGMAQDNVVTGLILRDEKVINTAYSGYLNYFTRDAVRVSKGTLVYSLDETREIYEQLVNSKVSDQITDDDRKYLRDVISAYREKGSLQDYAGLAEFSEDVNEAVLSVYGNYSSGKVAQLNLSAVPKTFHVYYSDSAGLISFNADKLSGLTLERVSEATWDDAPSYKAYTKRKSLAASGDAVMKFITNDTWQILCPLNSSQLKSLDGLKSVPITITNDGLKLTLPMEIIRIEDKPYALFTLDDYIQNYLDHRFLSVQLNWQVSEGYKIPLSAITEKTFYIVPKEYFEKGGNLNNYGLVRETVDSKTQNASYDFVESTIYYDDGMYYYIDAADFKAGDVVITKDGGRFTIGITEKLEGVYNINKGYAVFRRIERITQNKDY